ncbi:MAG: hypothetical protein VW714_08080 [Rhodospirillales bacterium]|jgi:hypothetical protein
MTPSEFARSEFTAFIENVDAANMDKPAAIRALLDTAASALAEISSIEDAKNELSFIAANIGDEEDYSFMRP